MDVSAPVALTRALGAEFDRPPPLVALVALVVLEVLEVLEAPLVVLPMVRCERRTLFAA